MNVDKYDIDPLNEGQIKAAADRENLRPPSKFRGAFLWDYVGAAELCFGMVRSEADTTIYAAAALVYVLTKRGEPTFLEDFNKHIGSLPWENIQEFRMRVLKFADTFTDDEKLEAMDILKLELNMVVITDVVTEAKKNPGKRRAGILAKKKESIRAGTPGKSSLRRKR